MTGWLWNSTHWFWHTNWLIFEIWLLVFIMLFMNNVAVTDGDKVEAEIRLGYHVDNAPIAQLVPYVNAVTKAEIDALVDEYEKLYDFAADSKKGTEKHQFVRDAAAQEIGLRRFLQDHVLSELRCLLRWLPVCMPR